MNRPTDSSWHFYVMIIASLFLFIFIIRFIIGKASFIEKRKLVFLLSFFIVVIGMLFGKFGANWGLPWWIYYTIPMLTTVLLPPILLKLNTRSTIYYLFLSFLSAPFIHAFFSFFLGWNEYMPFWEIPYWKTLIG